MKTKDNKPHIGIFGRRNNGKSSLINALTGQNIAIVSEISGTTTDPVKKSVEIPGIGPVVLIDTAGIDDSGDLGNLRVEKAKTIIGQVDLAILVLAENVFDKEENNLIQGFNNYNLPYIIIQNKCDKTDVIPNLITNVKSSTGKNIVRFSAVSPAGYLPELLTTIKENMPSSVFVKTSLLGDLLSYGDIVLLITPIDIEAPEGRMILPQVQVIRDILDNDCTAIILKEREVDGFLRKSGPHLRPPFPIV